MPNLKMFIPLIVFIGLLALLWQQLFHAKPNELPSPFIGESVPTFTLPDLFQANLSFTEKNLQGHVSLLNVWSTWCPACQYEHRMLMKIKNDYHIPIYGIDYKDDPQKAIAWLTQYGNPFVITGQDQNGNVAIDFGVYGTPETFVINASGKIIYRHIGIIDEDAWEHVLYPLICHASESWHPEKR